MKIQAAIDRVSVEEAADIISDVKDSADIVEIGTSLIKDFGLNGSIRVLKKRFPKVHLLADIKTCDEGAYEFQKTYEAGADIATVMGFSSMTTIRACAEVAEKFGKRYMIDLLEVGEEKIESLKRGFPEAIFAIHLPADQNGEGLETLVRREVAALEGVKTVAAAGGVRLENMALMKDAGVGLVIVGSGITKAQDRRAAAAAFRMAADE